MSQRRVVAQPCGLALAVSIILAGVAWRAAAQTPASDYAKLQQLTSQLQNSPANDALRKQIIALALTLPRPPAESTAAVEARGAGMYGFKHAQSPADFFDAGQSFDHAALLAPWVASDYYNAAQAFKKAGHYRRAITELHWYLAAAPRAANTEDVLEQIGGLKWASSHHAPQAATAQTSTPQSSAQNRQKTDSLAGMWKISCQDNSILGVCGPGAFIEIGGSQGNWSVCYDQYPSSDPNRRYMTDSVDGKPCNRSEVIYSGARMIRFRVNRFTMSCTKQAGELTCDLGGNTSMHAYRDQK